MDGVIGRAAAVNTAQPAVSPVGKMEELALLQYIDFGRVATSTCLNDFGECTSGVTISFWWWPKEKTTNADAYIVSNGGKVPAS